MKGTRLKTYDRSRSIRAPPWQRSLVAIASTVEKAAIDAVVAQQGGLEDHRVAEMLFEADDMVTPLSCLYTLPSLPFLYPRPPNQKHGNKPVPSKFDACRSPTI